MAIYTVRFRGHTGVIPRWTFGFHIQSVTGQAGVIADASHDGFNAMWDGVPAGTNALKGLYDALTVCDDVLVDELDTDNVHNVAQAVVTINRAGTGAAQPLPPTVSITCLQSTVLPTRRGTGRSSLPPPTEATTDTGRMLAADRDLVANAYGNLIEHMNALGFEVVVLHRDSKPGTVHPTPAGPPTPVVGVKVSDVFGSARKRRRKLQPVYTAVATP